MFGTLTLCDLAEAFKFRRDSFSEALASDDVRAVHEAAAISRALQVDGYPSVLLVHRRSISDRSATSGGRCHAHDITDLLAEPNA